MNEKIERLKKEMLSAQADLNTAKNKLINMEAHVAEAETRYHTAWMNELKRTLNETFKEVIGREEGQ